MSSTIDIVRAIEDFKSVPDDQLQWLVDQGSILALKQGDKLFDKDQPTDHLHIVLDGNIKIFFEQNGKFREVAVLKSGNISGVLPYSRMTMTRGIAEATQESHVLEVHRSRFEEMIREKHKLTEALVHRMTSRVRNFTALQQQNEKLMALGKLSTGLAHELNNPAAAIVRSSSELKKHLQALPENFKSVINIKMTDEMVDAVNHTLFSKIGSRKDTFLSLMEKTEREDEITDWLEEHGVEDGYEVSDNLVEFGFTVEDLNDILEKTTAAYFPPVIKWINDNLTTEKMVEEIEEASKRISDLIGSVKSYTHMDQEQDRQFVNLHEGIRNTITMLQHKFKKANIELKEDFAPDLPQIKGYPGELNQVWTNLLDNAIDAIEGKEGSIEVKTEFDGKWVKVSITDSGKGIPEKIQPRIFDPFFTTKDLGKGTGLGLDVVHKIILHHQGDIKVESVPGKTVFIICLQIES